MKLIWLHIIVMSALLCSVSDSQQLVVKRYGQSDSLQTYSAGTVVGQVVHQRRILSSATVDMNEKVNVIVQLTAPVATSNKISSVKSRTEASAQNVQFAQRLSSVAPGAKITHQFTRAINAIALTTDRASLSTLASLTGVKRIYEDKPVKAFAVSSGSAQKNSIGRFLSAINATGKGIKIGVIDTGIDYMHEAFGGGFGKGYKVAGGYDFVNNDNDPMDDNGHGTHVAGIIAGESNSFSGIAPDAILYAYKVLDATGSGSMSTVIEGIEQALADSVNIINLSLGSSSGDPSDILSQAVNQAVESGVIVVAAAGNNGDYGTIGSPGAAQFALTVGAVDANGQIASFSSKGPSGGDYGLKPDIVAPGVNILSAQLNGGYITMTGTSMAAPFVTGLAARLRELNPDWTALEVENAIIESAVNLSQPIFAQGNGLADTSSPVTKSAIFSPPHFSFGFDPPSVQTWTQSDTIVVSNITATEETYSFTSQITQPGITCTVEPKQVNVAPLASDSVVVTISVENGSVPNNTQFSQGYSGEIIAQSNQDTTDLPFVFFKGTALELSFSETPFQVLIHDRKSVSYTYNPQSAFLSVAVPSGTYDIVTTFLGSAYVIRENVDPALTPELFISRDEASNVVSISPANENGEPLVPTASGGYYCSMEILTHVPSGISQVVISGGAIQTASLVQQKMFSTLNPDYTFSYSLNFQFGTAQSYTYDISLDSGLTSNKNISFLSSDFRHVDFKYDVDSSVSRIFPITWLNYVQNNNVIGVSLYDPNGSPLTYPFTQSGYYTKRPDPNFPIFHLREAYKY
jgi:subtilisin family serine protease